MKLIHITEGLKFLSRRIKVKYQDINKYQGDARQICREIIYDCFNERKKYFMVSSGHFKLFYSRDFGWVTKALIDLGYKKQVKQTLEYALNHFKKHGRIRTTISKNGIVFDFPYYAVDSLPYILNSLSELDDNALLSEYKEFLEKEIKYFTKKVINDKGLVRKDRYFSSMKDHSRRRSSCYDNCMLYMMQQACKKLGLINPLKKYDYKKLITNNFWNGEYFIDDLSGNNSITGDTNVFPYWTGLIKNKAKMKKSIDAIRKAKLDKPFPLKYTSNNNKNNLIKESLFADNYEGNTIWMHMGPLFIEIVGKIDKKLQKEYLKKYKNILLKNKNYLEVFDKNGKPYKNIFYYSDESMIWCSCFLDMLEKTNLK